jgi:hypothetical protein
MVGNNSHTIHIDKTTSNNSHTLNRVNMKFLSSKLIKPITKQRTRPTHKLDQDTHITGRNRGKAKGQLHNKILLHWPTKKTPQNPPKINKKFNP